MRFRNGALQYASIFVFIITIATIVTVAWSHRANAAGDRYKFLAKGIVTEVNTTGNTIRVVATYASDQAKSDLLGTAIDYTVKGSTFYKWQNGKKNRVTFTKVAQVGDEVVVYGAAKANGQYNASWVVCNDRSFSVIGKLREHKAEAKQLRLEVISSTYKDAYYKNKEIWVEYGNNAKLYTNTNAEMNWDDLTVSDQRFKVQGSIQTNKWDVTKAWDNYKKAK